VTPDPTDPHRDWFRTDSGLHRYGDPRFPAIPAAVIPDPSATPEEQGLTPGGEIPTPDPRLVAALAAAHRAAAHPNNPRNCAEPHAHEQIAAAILPGFLADPRTHEVFAERLERAGYGEVTPGDLDQYQEWGGSPRKIAAAILGADDA
jgi:hypothetical protein